MFSAQEMRSSLNQSRLDFRYGWIILALCLIGNLGWQPVQAAPILQSGQPQEATIYIVQPGDTLYGIAQQFDITVDLLVAANGIDDPSHIAVGQRLIIPPSPAPPEESLIHTVQAGETLHSLDLRYSPSLLELAQANYLIRANKLYISQNLTIYGHSSEPPPLYGQSLTVRPGETLLELAAQYHVTPWSLASANDLQSPFVTWPDKHLWVPGDEGEFLDWTPPFAGFQIHPIPAMQGQALSIQISLTLPVSITGNWMGAPLTFFPRSESAAALIGVDALAEPGIYTLVITAPTERGNHTSVTQQIPVLGGEYGAENIVVSNEIAAAMTPQVVQSETELLEQIFSAQTPLPLWDGYFGLPAAGDVTSAFGTRRSYNIPNASAFHTGTDFGTSIGTPIYAPANGIVVFSELLTVRGNTIIIDHGWGVMTGYWHLSASHVLMGDTVSQGQHIGDIGSTGLSTGPHLHWEMRVGGVPVNGLQWVWEQFP